MDPIFTEPTEEDYRFLASHWVSIVELVLEEYQQELDQELQSLDLLQRVRDDDLVGHEGYVALGVALGRIMARNIEGLDWSVVKDAFGTEHSLRYRDTSLIFNPISMVMKRSAIDTPLNFRELFETTQQKTEELGPIVDR